MRIAFVVNTYPPRLGGLEQHLFHLTQGLTDVGHDVTVLTIGSPMGQRQDGKVAVLTGRANFPVADVISFPHLGSRRRITTFLREGNFDVVSVHTRFFPMSFVGVRAAHAAGIPAVHTEHGSGFVASNSPIIGPASKIVDLTLGRYVLHHADRVLGVSQEAADFAERLGAPNADVFYNAITPSEATTSPVDRPGHLVFVGRMVPGKGWDTYLETIANLRAQGHEVDGEMLGAGADLDAARALAKKLGVDGVVAIPGRVPADQVRRSLAGATLVNPTVLSEGFQTTMLEAVAESGRVVTFPVPGAEVLRDAGMPVIITGERTTQSLTQALEGYVRQPPALAAPGLIDAWTWPHRVREYAAILDDVVKNS